MLMLIKITLWVLCLYSSVIFSGQMGKCTDDVWQFGGHAFYAELSPGGIEFENLDLSLNLPWSWGFALEGSYQYGGSDDISMHWFHYRSPMSNQLQEPNATIMFSPAWDQVNLELGKTIQFKQMEKLRFHAGLNFSRLAYEANLSFERQLDQAPTNLSQWQRMDASYNGLGLRSGLLLAHDFQNHLTLFVDAAVSLLAGSAKFATLNNFGSVNTSQMWIVPEFDARVGTQYDYHLSEGLLSAEISWLWLNYVNAFTHEAKHFGLQGLYFGLKWSGDIYYPHALA